jgi:hypothetical protein
VKKVNFVRYILGFVDFFSGSGSAGATSVRIKKNDHMKKLISKGSSNSKTAKNALETHILYLMPHNRNSKGTNLCVDASLGCIHVCLVDAGLASVYTSVNLARLARTELYLSERQQFCDRVLHELFLLNKKAIKKGGIIEIRLNGTSDLDFVGIIKNRCNFDILTFSNLVFYDYTKSIGKVKKYVGNSKYVLTFSRSETNENDCLAALAMGVNVSVVFDHKKAFPATYLGTEVISGDVADDVMLKVSGKILGLKAKGSKAKNDVSGFVVR